MKKIEVSVREKELLCLMRKLSVDLSVSVAEMIASVRSLEAADADLSKILRSLSPVKGQGNLLSFEIADRVIYRETHGLIKAIAVLKLTLKENISQLIATADLAIHKLKDTLTFAGVREDLIEICRSCSFSVYELKKLQDGLEKNINNLRI